VVEVNASDTRSKSDAKAGTGIGGKLSNVVREMVTSQALAAASGVKRRQVLVMDEVDGMAGALPRQRGGETAHGGWRRCLQVEVQPLFCVC
jgi:replication factor C subunit 1